MPSQDSPSSTSSYGWSLPSLLTSFLRTLSRLNPVTIYREERERDRQVQIEIVREVTGVLGQLAQVMLSQQQLMTTFLGSFQTDGQPPRSWENTSEEFEIERIAAGLGMSKEDYLRAI